MDMMGMGQIDTGSVTVAGADHTASQDMNLLRGCLMSCEVLSWWTASKKYENSMQSIFCGGCELRGVLDVQNIGNIWMYDTMVTCGYVASFADIRLFNGSLQRAAV